MIQLFLLILMVYMFSSCSEKKVPHDVQMHFLEMEPSAQDISWTVEENIYQVNYIVNFKKATSYFDLKGSWLETESEIEKSELPIAISNTLIDKLCDYSIIDIELVKTQNNITLYEVDLMKEDKVYDILFSKSGKILRKKI